MKRTFRVLVTMLAVIIGVSFVMPAQAASKKKTVYVMTKAVVTDYESEDTYAYNISYKKNGLISKSSLSISGWAGISFKFKYNGKSQIKKQTNKQYFLGTKVGSGSAKFTYTKKGYLKKSTLYNRKGKKAATHKYSWNSNGQQTADRKYNSKGKLVEATYYTYDKNGQCTSRREYENGSLVCRVIYKNTGANSDMMLKYDSSGNLQEKTYRTFKHGDVVSATSYDADGFKTSVSKCYYKKVSTKKAGKVTRQQESIFSFLEIE